MFTIPRSSASYPPSFCKSFHVTSDMWTFRGKPTDSILEAVFTVSPNKQYLGIFRPTTPATQWPENKNMCF